MSDLDNAINSINESAAKAENTATFLDDMSTFDDQSSVTNPNNGQTVASIPKQVKDRTDELFTAAESDINQAVTDAAQSATDAQDAADSIGRYQGLWPDTGGIAEKGDTYQTQVSGTPTGQYFTALQNTTVDPIGDDVNWREVVSGNSIGLQEILVPGTTTPRDIENRFGDIKRPEDCGAVGDGLVDDHPALQYMCDNFGAMTLAVDAVYNLNGKILSIPSGFALISTLASTIKNGSISCTGASFKDNTFGDITLIDCDARIGGTLVEDNYATGFKIGRIVSNEIFRLQYMKDFEIESIRVDIPESKDSATQRAMGFTSLYEGKIGLIHLSGYYAMGFETAGNGSTPDEYASRNVVIDAIISNRNPLATSSSGYHGVYLHGNYNLIVKSLYSVGYDISEQGVSNDFKFRDNWECKVNKVSCLTMQMASDANSTTLNSLEDNLLENINLAPYPESPDLVGKATATVNGSGLFNKNIINNFKGDLGTSGALTTGGDEAIKMVGNITYVKDGDLQLSNITYESACVEWSNAETNYYTRSIVCHNTTFKDRIRIKADLETYSSRLAGGLRMEAGSSTRSLTHHNTVVEVDWDTFLSTGTVNADISNTDIQVDRPPLTLRPNGDVRYRFVSFNNGYYLADDDDTNFVGFP